MPLIETLKTPPVAAGLSGGRPAGWAAALETPVDANASGVGGFDGLLRKLLATPGRAQTNATASGDALPAPTGPMAPENAKASPESAASSSELAAQAAPMPMPVFADNAGGISPESMPDDAALPELAVSKGSDAKGFDNKGCDVAPSVAILAMSAPVSSLALSLRAPVVALQTLETPPVETSAGAAPESALTPTPLAPPAASDDSSAALPVEQVLQTPASVGQTTGSTAEATTPTLEAPVLSATPPSGDVVGQTSEVALEALSGESPSDATEETSPDVAHSAKDAPASASDGRSPATPAPSPALTAASAAMPSMTPPAPIPSAPVSSSPASVQAAAATQPDRATPTASTLPASTLKPDSTPVAKTPVPFSEMPAQAQQTPQRPMTRALPDVSTPVARLETSEEAPLAPTLPAADVDSVDASPASVSLSAGLAGSPPANSSASFSMPSMTQGVSTSGDSSAVDAVLNVNAQTAPPPGRAIADAVRAAGIAPAQVAMVASADLPPVPAPASFSTAPFNGETSRIAQEPVSAARDASSEAILHDAAPHAERKTSPEEAKTLDAGQTAQTASTTSRVAFDFAMPPVLTLDVSQAKELGVAQPAESPDASATPSIGILSAATSARAAMPAAVMNTAGAMSAAADANPLAPAEQAGPPLAAAVASGRKEVTLRLNPESLGAVRAHLSVSAHLGVRARLIAETPQARDLLLKDVETLRQAIESQGVRVDRIQIACQSDAATASPAALALDPRAAMRSEASANSGFDASGQSGSGQQHASGGGQHGGARREELFQSAFQQAQQQGGYFRQRDAHPHDLREAARGMNGGSDERALSAAEAAADERLARHRDPLAGLRPGGVSLLI